MKFTSEELKACEFAARVPDPDSWALRHEVEVKYMIQYVVDGFARQWGYSLTANDKDVSYWFFPYGKQPDLKSARREVTKITTIHEPIEHLLEQQPNEPTK